MKYSILILVTLILRVHFHQHFLHLLPNLLAANLHPQVPECGGAGGQPGPAPGLRSPDSAAWSPGGHAQARHGGGQVLANYCQRSRPVSPNVARDHVEITQ